MSFFLNLFNSDRIQVYHPYGSSFMIEFKKDQTIESLIKMILSHIKENKLYPEDNKDALDSILFCLENPNAARLGGSGAKGFYNPNTTVADYGIENESSVVLYLPLKEEIARISNEKGTEMELLVKNSYGPSFMLKISGNETIKSLIQKILTYMRDSTVYKDYRAEIEYDLSKIDNVSLRGESGSPEKGVYSQLNKTLSDYGLMSESTVTISRAPGGPTDGNKAAVSKRKSRRKAARGKPAVAVGVGKKSPGKAARGKAAVAVGKKSRGKK